MKPSALTEELEDSLFGGNVDSATVAKVLGG